MDLEVLNKKIGTYRTDGGYVKNIPDDLLMEVLFSWEQWTGPASGFHSAIGVSPKRMGSLIGKAKKLKREGRFAEEAFKEVKLAEALSSSSPGLLPPCSGIEIAWDNGKLIRFSQVEQLVDFLKRVA